MYIEKINNAIKIVEQIQLQAWPLFVACNNELQP